MKSGTTIRLITELSKDYVLSVNIYEPKPNDETDNYPFWIEGNWDPSIEVLSSDTPLLVPLITEARVF
jgi:hypothetical protein